MSRAAIAVGGAVVTGGLAVVAYGWLYGDYRTLKHIEPDYQAPTPPPGANASGGGSVPDKTGYKLVDALLPKLKDVARITGIPLGLMIAWIAKESGGKITSHTNLDERGYYQLMPDESKSLGLDHERLSSDSDYSLDAGTKLIHKYQGAVDNLNAVPKGSSFYWLLVKLAHTVGTGQMKKWVTGAQKAGSMGSWSDFSSYVLGERWTGPQPSKWMPFLSTIYKLGRPFGFGAEASPLISGLADDRCVYCADGYHDMCDRSDSSGPCRCGCQKHQVSGLLGLDVFAGS